MGGVYENRLKFFGGNLQVVLPALWEERDDSSWRVTFLSVGAEVLGKSAFQIKFPPGKSKTWWMTYADADTRVVRAGNDKSNSGSWEEEDDEVFVFFMTREE